MSTTSRTTDNHPIEARLGAWFAAALTAGTANVQHDVSERLRFAREQALARARDVRRAMPAAAALVGLSARGAATLGGFVPWWQRAASLLPLFVLVFGLLAIDRWATHEQVMAAADIDSQLLSDDLPPAAYSDPGFAEFLRTGPAP